MLRNRINYFTALTTVGIFLLGLDRAYGHHMLDGSMPTTFLAGLVSGIAHPVIGLDHLMFLIIVGVLLVGAQNRSRIRVTTMFGLGTLAGAVAHLGSLNLPGSEIVVAASVIAGGAIILSDRRPSATVLMMTGTLIGIFHGYAYGESIVGAENGPVLAYLIGFSVIQCVIIGVILMVMDWVHSRSTTAPLLVQKSAGLVCMLTGVVFIFRNLI